VSERARRRIAIATGVVILLALSAWVGLGGGVSPTVTSPPNGSVLGLSSGILPYDVQFEERGLPSSSSWTVTLNGIPGTSTSATVDFNLPNGTYAYSVAVPANYAIVPSTGTITVNGGLVSVALSATARIQHVVVIMLENENLTSVLKNGAYQAYLYHQYGSVTNYFGVCHNSPQNYVTIASGYDGLCGSLTSQCPICLPHSHVFNNATENLADNLEEHNDTWDEYAESMNGSCNQTMYPVEGPKSIYYGWDHDPFFSYADVVKNDSRCDTHVLNSQSFNNTLANGALPTFAMYTPNQMDDCHNSGLAFCDRWLQQFLAPILNHTGSYSSAATQNTVNHTAFLVVYDEGDELPSDAGYNIAGFQETRNCENYSTSICGGHTYVAVISPYSVRTTFGNDTSDFAITSTIEWLFGLPSDGGYDGAAAFPAYESLFRFPAPVTYGLTFQESGLPAGGTWSVTLNGTPLSRTTDGGTDALSMLLPSGAHPYSIAGVSGWFQNSMAHQGIVTLTNGPVTERLTYSRTTYVVTFSETGLPGGLTWAVTVGGTQMNRTTDGGTDLLTFPLPNGTYPYTIANVPGWFQNSTPYVGNVIVNNASKVVSMTYSAATYAVTFSETGLPAGLTWAVTVHGVRLSRTTDGGLDSLTFTLPNGTYVYSIAGMPGWSQNSVAYNGTVTVANGPLPMYLVYTTTTYGVTFSESGLPTNAAWSVAVDGRFLNQTTNNGTITLANGTYPYTVADVSGYNLSTPSSGNAIVSGSPVVVTVVFQPIVSSLIFNETGLPPGVNWSVTIGGTPLSGVGNGGADGLSATLANGTYSYSIAIVPGYYEGTVPYSGTVAVKAQTMVDLTFVPAFAVTLDERGLPAGKLLAVTLGGAQTTGITGVGNTTLTGWLPDGQFPYVVAGVPGWYQDSIPYSGSVPVVGGATLNVSFCQVTYNITLSETGLPPGANWNASVSNTSLNGATANGPSTLTFPSEPNGSYSYSISPFPGYYLSAYGGALVVNGMAAVVNVTFELDRYAVVFIESGLPASTPWGITFNGSTVNSTSPTIPFSATNGNYSYQVGAVAGYRTTEPGWVLVNATNVSVSIPYTPVTSHYAVSFTESGLASGTNWSVTLNGTPRSSTSTSISFMEPNGTYTYSIGLVVGYGQLSGSNLTVAGNGVTVPEHFSNRTYTVMMEETGLAGSPRWGVTIGTSTLTSTSDVIKFHLVNGTYAYSISIVPGWSTTPHGNLTVAGSTVTVTSHFTRVKYAVTFSETGLPSHASWSLTITSDKHSTTGATIKVNLANGTYSYTISGPTGYTNNGTGSVTVNGNALTVRIGFTHQGPSASGGGADPTLQVNPSARPYSRDDPT
jgi:phosphoesterase family protein